MHSNLFHHKDVVVMLTAERIYRRTYQAVKPACSSEEQALGNITLQYWVTAEQHVTEANAVTNKFNGLFIQERAHAIHWSLLGTM